MLTFNGCSHLSLLCVSFPFFYHNYRELITKKLLTRNQQLLMPAWIWEMEEMLTPPTETQLLAALP